MNSAHAVAEPEEMLVHEMEERVVADQLLRGLRNVDLDGLDLELLVKELRRMGAEYAAEPKLRSCVMAGGARDQIQVFLDLYFMILRFKF